MRMRRPLLATVVVLASVALPVPAADDPFLRHPAEAFDRSRETGRPLLIEFHAAWCSVCEEMTRTTWNDRQVREAMSRYVALSVDGERNTNLVERYRVDAYPTVVVADPRGRAMLVLLGFQDATAMQRHLEQVQLRWTELQGWSEEADRRRADPTVLLQFADFARERTAWEQAERLYRRTLKEPDRLAGESAATARLGLAEVLAVLERCGEAGRLLRRAGPPRSEDSGLRHRRVRELCGGEP